MVGPAAAQTVGGRAADVRLQLASVQNALIAEDRVAFDDRLATLRSSPEARADSVAQDLLPLYELAARLWDVQFTTAFFGEDSEIFGQITRYRGATDALMRNVVTDANGRRFFAAREAKQFLAATARERLTQAGVATVSTPAASRSAAPASASRATTPPRASTARSSRRIRRAKD